MPANYSMTNVFTSYVHVGFGAVYTRWGKNSCPNNTETVYSGMYIKVNH